MQLYASYKYPRGEIHKLKPGTAASLAQPLTPDMLQSPDGSTRRVGPFNMKPDTAKKYTYSQIVSHQRAMAEQWLQQAYKADATRGLNLSVDMQGFSTAPVYLPVYVYRSRHVGNEKVRTFVSGVDGRVVGTRVYDETKVGLLGALIGACGVLFTGVWQHHPLLQCFWVGVALPGLLTGLLARYWPYVKNQFQRVSQETEQFWYRESDRAGAWDTSFSHAYSQYEFFRRQREERAHFQYEQRQSSERVSADASDPKGYYAMLELKPSASQAEVQAAFRGEQA